MNNGGSNLSKIGTIYPNSGYNRVTYVLKKSSNCMAIQLQHTTSGRDIN